MNKYGPTELARLDQMYEAMKRQVREPIEGLAEDLRNDINLGEHPAILVRALTHGVMRIAREDLLHVCLLTAVMLYEKVTSFSDLETL